MSSWHLAMGCSVYPWTGRVILLALGILLGLSTCDCKKIPRWWLKVAEKQGPNVCVVEEIPGTNKEFWTECRYWLNRDICGIKTLTRFECCEGFDQLDDEEGCNLVKPLRNVLDTAESLGATEWVNYIRQSGKERDLEGPGAYTFFVPTNEAFNAVSHSLREQLETYRSKYTPSNPILMYHIVPSRIKSEDFTGDLSVETLNHGHNLRINKYSNGMTTINCALLVRKDQEASNGIVHIIDGVLDPSRDFGSNVADMILMDGRFQILANMAEKSGYINVLRTMHGSMSIFAPSDEAFQKIPESKMEKIINDKEASLAILQNHIIPHVICESAITGEHKVRNLGKNKLTFNCDIDGAYVESTKLKSNFELGQNGILHMIDDVLLPNRAKNLLDLARSLHLNTFVQLIEKSGLEEMLTNSGDYTFFVPQENAWNNVSDWFSSKLRNDPSHVEWVLRNHGANGRYLTKEITNNQVIMPLNEENRLRLQIWRKGMGIEDAKILEQDLEAQNGVIHIIDRVIFPTDDTVFRVLELKQTRDQPFDMFPNALEIVAKTSPGLINFSTTSDIFYTFFVPSDSGFFRMSQNQVVDMFGDKELATEMVKNHVAVNMFPEAYFEPGLTYPIDGMGGKLRVTKSKSGKLKVNGVNVLSSHNSANGIVHLIEDVLFVNYDPNFRWNATKETSSSAISTPSQTSGSSSFISRSSSSSSSRSSEKDNRGELAYSESFNNNFQRSLRPKGSTIYASSMLKKPEHVSPEQLSSHKKNTLNKNNISSKKNTSYKNNTSPKKKNSSKKVRISRKRSRKIFRKRKSRKNRRRNRQEVKVIVPVNQNTRDMDINRVYQSTTKPYPELKIDDYSPVEFVAKEHELSSRLNGTIYSKSSIPPNKTEEVNVIHPNHHASLTSTKSYIHKGEGWEIPYKEPGYINGTYLTRKFYNTTINSAYHPVPERITYHNVPATQTHSKSYSYKYVSKVDNYNHSPLHKYNLNANSPQFHDENALSDLSSGKHKFSYVGHHYGNDDIGRRETVQPFSVPRAAYVNTGSRHSARYRKPHNDYAFTGDDNEFADGSEFLAHPPEEFVSKRQARFYRRLRRKKRHHKKRKSYSKNINKPKVNKVSDSSNI